MGIYKQLVEKTNIVQHGQEFKPTSGLLKKVVDITYSIYKINFRMTHLMPKHCLHLKVRMSIMLLTNINSVIGMCNDTRLIIRHMGNEA